jgi:ferredoxin
MVQVDGRARLSGLPAGVSGHLGGFRLRFETPNGELDLARATGGWRESFDLVLDLTPGSLIESAVPPVGYYAAGEGTEALERALAELPTLVGEFEKPQFFAYDPDICAHGRSGIQACRRCLDVCPTDAITSIGERIQVDPNLCQGVGACATACPTGAIRYAYPSLSDLLDALRAALHAYQQAGGAPGPCLVIYGQEQEGWLLEAVRDRLPGWLIPMEVEETASVGMEFWLSALAYGAGQVRLLMAPATPEGVVTETRAQLDYAQGLMEAMGYPADAVQMLVTADPDGLVDALAPRQECVAVEPAGFAGLDEKRRVLSLAVEHLYGQATRPRPLASLPAGAPFGEVWVDTQRCTLCMACVSQCPGRALDAGGDTPQLRFIEDNCVQCGLCARSCPENAIGPSPRYLFDPEQRRRRRLLNEDAPFHCVSCGKVFGTRSLVERMAGKLRTHPMFQGDALRRLRMCEDCRVRDMYRADVSGIADPDQVHGERGGA